MEDSRFQEEYICLPKADSNCGASENQEAAWAVRAAGMVIQTDLMPSPS